jgi:molybdopterin-guanine dinucleotide biosynthesis protein A
MNGLILAGGQSSRMGQPKSLLQYHGKPQYQHLMDLLSGFCGQVFLSCREEQKELFTGCETIFDSAQLGDIGPINGILSAFERDKTNAWLVLGCDYPMLEKSDLEQLVQARNSDAAATIFIHPETQFLEPLIGIYEASTAPLLLEWWKQGHQSLRHFLAHQSVHKIRPLRLEALKSVDTPEERDTVRPPNHIP